LLRTGTDYAEVIGVTQLPGGLPLGAAGWADLTGATKGVWIQQDRTQNYAATAMQEIAHTFHWAIGAPNECQEFPGHLCNVPAPGYWVARDGTIENAIDFMNPSSTSSFEWVSSETYQYLLNALKQPVFTKLPGNATAILKP